MSDDYLWDGSGARDPEVERLESLLRPYRLAPEAPDPAAARRLETRGSRRLLTLVAAALVLGVMVWAILTRETQTSGWQVENLVGTPQLDGRTLEPGDLGIGEWLETDDRSRARLRLPPVSGISGTVDVEEQTRLRLTAATAGEQRLELARGRISAFVAAPPRLFFVDTPSATAIDYGCAYELEVDDAGSGSLEVTLGWVALERDGYLAHVPAGARCILRPERGPGTPHFTGVSDEFAAALATLDLALLDDTPREGAEAEQQDALALVLTEAKPRDTLTLWHLLQTRKAGDRSAILKRIDRLAGIPLAVDPLSLLAGEAEALETLREHLNQHWR